VPLSSHRNASERDLDVVVATERDFLVCAYEQIARIRSFEELALALSTGADPSIAGSVHTCIGQEAVPVGTLAALRPDDQIVATYRGHGWALQSGIEPYELLAELCHRADGVNGGRAGSALMMAPHHRFVGENSIVGAGIPIACGAAMAAVAQGSDRVVVVSFGDGATSQGALHEGLVLAAARRLPVVFICENNGWSEMTPVSEMVPLDRLARRAAGYGIRGLTIDGPDPLAVRDTVAQAAADLRRGAGPVFLECRVPRLSGHYNRDIEHNRSKEDRADAVRRDPLETLGAKLISAGFATADALACIRSAAVDEVAAWAKRVSAAPHPTASSAAEHVVSSPSASPRSVPVGPIAEVRELSLIQAVNEALRTELATRPEVLVYGEDVGKAGGIFAATRSLQREFGTDRVFDMPIAESAILGSAVGAAMCGQRPVVEIMWADFLLVALDQLINQAANVRYLTRGRCSVPLVVRTQQGATPGSCAQHSQSLEALLAHIPGLRVGLPTTPQDAYDMLRAAVADPDPCIIIESRALYQTKASVTFAATPGPIGGAALRVPGRDVALVGWGAVMPQLLEASRQLGQDGIEAAVLDLRWLSPLDDASLSAVVMGCQGQAVIAHDANLTGGFGAEIAARLHEQHGHGAICIRRVASPDIRVPAAPLQRALLPDAAAIVRAAKSLVPARLLEAESV